MQTKIPKEEELKIIEDLLIYGSAILKNGKIIQHTSFFKEQKEQNEEKRNTKEKS